MFSYPYYTSQANPSKDITAHSGPDTPTSIINQENTDKFAYGTILMAVFPHQVYQKSHMYSINIYYIIY